MYPLAAMLDPSKHKQRHHTMFKTLQTRVQQMMSKPHARIVNRLDNLLDQARINADDTIYVEKAADPKKWDKIALMSLESLLAYSTDLEVQAWFKKNGVRW